ncbi:MAG TPA: TAXI family TRAP transporter solute-binding subunit [Kineosporiaceae bacterium]|nr:TAXI family TRAP transporter solute-binding subunit [Kineosporiaceae bacterium]
MDTTYPLPLPRRRRPSRRQVLLGALAALNCGALAMAVTGSWQSVEGRLSLATGPVGAAYLDVGRDLAAAVKNLFPKVDVQVRITAASVENLALLSAGTVDVGFVSLDAALGDSDVRRKTITAVSRVFDSSLHLVVPAESQIHTLLDLQGRRVGVGGDASGTEFTATALLSAVGVTPARLVRLAQTQAMTALEIGALDAAFSLTAFPTPAIANLAHRRRIRLIPLAEHHWLMARTGAGAYSQAPIPVGTYEGVPAVETITMPSLLMARSGLSPALVDVLLSAMFTKKDERFWRHPESRTISLGMAAATGGATLTPAASAWLNSHNG